MPNPGSDEPLEKVTLNLYAADVRYLRAKYPKLWSTEVREMVHDNVVFLKSMARINNDN